MQQAPRSTAPLAARPLSLIQIQLEQHSRLVKAAIWFLCLLPAVRLLLGAFTDQLGSNPVEFVTRSTGTWTLNLLCVTLMVSPLKTLLNAPALLKLRRLLGLFAFFYALLHLTTWVWFDQWFDLHDMWNDVVKRPFITVGFTAVVLLIPLALTSNKASMKWLGRKWGMLHRLVYVIAVLGVLHYYWLVKKDVTQPVIYGLVVAGLLAWRLWRARRAIAK
jgi:methionine sulfoxide reductase heme-binding subunit